MKKSVRGIVIGVFCLLQIVVSLAMAGENEVACGTDPPQRLDTVFRLFKTQNIFNHLLLDTTTGRVWQIQFTISSDAPRARWPINPVSFVPAGERPRVGRFTLYPTQNIFTFILVDLENGNTWQVQWSTDDKNRGIMPIRGQTTEGISPVDANPGESVGAMADSVKALLERMASLAPGFAPFGARMAAVLDMGLSEIKSDRPRPIP
jgi:hypothetical protein